MAEGRSRCSHPENEVPVLQPDFVDFFSWTFMVPVVPWFCHEFASKASHKLTLTLEEVTRTRTVPFYGRLSASLL